MPRIKQFKDNYIAKDICCYIIGTMKQEGISQEVVASELGCTQQAFSKKLREQRISLKELIIIFRILNTEEEKISELFRR